MHTLQGIFVEKSVRKFIDTKGKLTIYIFCRHKTLISYVLTFIFLFTVEMVFSATVIGGIKKNQIN
jgi:hypothetical protein